MIKAIFSGNTVTVNYFREDDPVGYFKTSTASADLLDNDVWYINRVYVQKEDRRKHVGTDLVKRMQEEIKARNPKAILIVTPGGYDTPPQVQIAFYRSMGFVKGMHGNVQCLVLK